nr:MAG TPA: hypothetical protein [Inoviridae sp.]
MIFSSIGRTPARRRHQPIQAGGTVLLRPVFKVQKHGGVPAQNSRPSETSADTSGGNRAFAPSF